MFEHNLKIAWRNLLKYKQQTVISILGLAVGLTCFVVCNNGLRTELMWDRRIPGVEEIYVLTTSNSDNKVYPFVQTGIAGMIRDEFPEIEKMVVYFDLGGYTDKMCVVEQEDGTKTWSKEAFIYSDSSFIDFFGFKLLQGNWGLVKKLPDALILTESAAMRIFGTTEVVGRIFQDINDFNNSNRVYQVAAVMEDFPRQTRFETRAGLVLNPADKMTKQGGYKNDADILLRLRPGTDYKEVNKKLTLWLDQHPGLKEKQNVPQRLYPYLELREHWGPSGRWVFPLILSGIGLLVLLTAIFNYVLFMSGRMLNRQKEYAIRQISGAVPRVVFRMFATEIALSVGGAVLTSLILFEVMVRFLPEDVFSYFYLESEQNPLFKMGGYLLQYASGVLGIMLLVEWIILGRIRTISSLRNLQGGGSVHYKSKVQNLLLGIQLISCVLLGGGAYFLYAQQQYLQQRMMGKIPSEECKRIYEFSLNGDKLKSIRNDFRNMVNANPHIEMATRNGSSLLHPWTVGPDSWQLKELGTKGKNKLYFMYVDANYTEFIHAQIEEGRFFREDERLSAVVNREFIRVFGINPLGKEINFDYWQGVKSYYIVGIIEDILTSESDPKVVPCLYLPFDERDPNWSYYVKLRPGTDPEVLEPLKVKMQEQVNVFTPLWIKTLEEEIGWGIDDLKEIGFLMGVLALICVVISLLGIYSSMMLAVEKRRREMAIRKINGATLADIARIFVGHYLWLAMGAMLVAFPVLFLGVRLWLENYSYHLQITVWPFVMIFLVLILILLLTIGSQLLKIIRINPAETMKRE